MASGKQTKYIHSDSISEYAGVGLSTSDDLVFLANAQETTDSSRYYNWVYTATDETYDFYANIQLKGSDSAPDSSLTVGGDYSEAVAAEEGETANNKNLSFRVEAEVDNEAPVQAMSAIEKTVSSIQATKNLSLYLTSQTGALKANNLQSGTPVKDDNILIETVYNNYKTQWNDKKVYISSSKIIGHSIDVTENLTLGSDLSGTISSILNVDYQGLYTLSTLAEPPTYYLEPSGATVTGAPVDNVSSLTIESYAINAGNLILDHNFRGVLEAKLATEDGSLAGVNLVARLTPTIQNNTVSNVGIKTGTLTAKNGIWAGSIKVGENVDQTVLFNAGKRGHLTDTILAKRTETKTETVISYKYEYTYNVAALSGNKFLFAGIDADSVLISEMGSVYNDNALADNKTTEKTTADISVNVKGMEFYVNAKAMSDETATVTSEFNNNQFYFYGIHTTDDLTLTTVDSDVDISVNVSDFSIVVSNEGGGKNELTTADTTFSGNKFTFASLSAKNFTTDTFNGSAAVNISDLSAVIRAPFTYLTGEIASIAAADFSGVLTAANNFGGSFTVSISNMSFPAKQQQVSYYGIKAESIDVVGRVDSEIVCSIENLGKTSRNDAISTSTLKADAFAGKISTVSYGINAGSLTTKNSGDAFDISGRIFAGDIAIQASKLNLRISGAVIYEDNGMLLKNGEEGAIIAQKNQAEDSVEIAAGGYVQGKIQLYQGTNSITISSLGTLIGTMNADDGLLNLTINMEGRKEDGSAVIITDDSDITLTSTYTFSVNLDYIEGNQDIALIQYADNVIEKFGDTRSFIFVYQGKTYNCRMNSRVEDAVKVDSQIVEWDDGATATITAEYDEKANITVLSLHTTGIVRTAQYKGKIDSSYDISKRAVTVSWDAYENSGIASPVSYYELEYIVYDENGIAYGYDKDGNRAENSIAVKVDSDVLSYTIDGISSGETVKYRVRAIYDMTKCKENILWSDYQKQLTSAYDGNISATYQKSEANDVASIVFSWDALQLSEDFIASNYQLEVTVFSQGETRTELIDIADKLSYTLSSDKYAFKEGDTFSYRVRAVSDTGTYALWSTKNEQVAALFTGETAMEYDEETESAICSWSGQAGISELLNGGYEIEYADYTDDGALIGAVQTKILSSSDLVYDTESNLYTCTVSGVSENLRFRVRAVNGSSSNIMTNWSSYNTVIEKYNGTLTGKIRKVAENDSFLISWTPFENSQNFTVSNYELKYTSGGKTNTIATNLLSYEIPDIERGEEISFSIRAISLEGGASGWSDEISQVADYFVGTVSAVYSNAARTMTISWDSQGPQIGSYFIDGYEIQYLDYLADGTPIGSISTVFVKVEDPTVYTIENVSDRAEYRIRAVTGDESGADVVLSNWSSNSLPSHKNNTVVFDETAFTTRSECSNENTNIGSATAQLSWKAPVSNEAIRYYVIEFFNTDKELCNEDGSPFSAEDLENKVNALLDGTDKSISIIKRTKLVAADNVVLTGLQLDNYYYWRIRACSSVTYQNVVEEEIPYSSNWILGDHFRVTENDTAAPYFEKKTTPCLVSFDMGNPTLQRFKLTFQWFEAKDDISGVKNYIVEYRKQGETSWNSLEVLATEKLISGGVDYEKSVYVDKGTYEYRITAVDYAANSTTLPAVAYEIKNNLPVFDERYVSVKNSFEEDQKFVLSFYWNDASDIEIGVRDYTVRYKKSSDSAWSDDTYTVTAGKGIPSGNYTYSWQTTQPLEAGDYVYQIIAANYLDETSTVEKTITLSGEQPVITNVKAEAVFNNNDAKFDLTITWGADEIKQENNRIVQYKLQYCYLDSAESTPDWNSAYEAIYDMSTPGTELTFTAKVNPSIICYRITAKTLAGDSTTTKPAIKEMLTSTPKFTKYSSVFEFDQTTKKYIYTIAWDKVSDEYTDSETYVISCKGNDFSESIIIKSTDEQTPVVINKVEYNCSVSWEVSKGSYSYSISATNNFGNSSSVSGNTEIKSPAPVFTQSGLSNTDPVYDRENKTYSVTFSFGDASSGTGESMIPMEKYVLSYGIITQDAEGKTLREEKGRVEEPLTYEKGGDTPDINNFSADASFSVPGNYYYTVTVNNIAGESTTQDKTFTIACDPPAFSAENLFVYSYYTNDAAGSENPFTLRFAWMEAEDIVIGVESYVLKYKLSSDSTAWEDVSIAAEYKVEDGKHEWTTYDYKADVYAGLGSYDYQLTAKNYVEKTTTLSGTYKISASAPVTEKQKAASSYELNDVTKKFDLSIVWNDAVKGTAPIISYTVSYGLQGSDEAISSITVDAGRGTSSGEYAYSAVFDGISSGEYWYTVTAADSLGLSSSVRNTLSMHGAAPVFDGYSCKTRYQGGARDYFDFEITWDPIRCENGIAEYYVEYLLTQSESEPEDWSKATVVTVDPNDPLLVSGNVGKGYLHYRITAETVTGDTSKVSSTEKLQLTAPEFKTTGGYGTDYEYNTAFDGYTLYICWDWDAAESNSPIERYSISCKATGSTEWKNIVVKAEDEKTPHGEYECSVSWNGLLNGSYTYQLSALNSYGEASTQQKTVTIVLTTPSKPSITVTDAYDISIHQYRMNFLFGDSADETGIDSYTIEYKLASGTEWISRTVQAVEGISLYSWDVLAEGGDYMYRVIATSNAGQSSALEGTVQLTIDPPIFTGDLLYSNIAYTGSGLEIEETPFTLTLAWRKATDTWAEVKEYILEYKNSSAESWNSVTVSADDVSSWGNYDYMKTFAVEAGSYDFRVTAVNYGGTSTTAQGQTVSAGVENPVFKTSPCADYAIYQDLYKSTYDFKIAWNDAESSSPVTKYLLKYWKESALEPATELTVYSGEYNPYNGYGYSVDATGYAGVYQYELTAYNAVGGSVTVKGSFGSSDVSAPVGSFTGFNEPEVTYKYDEGGYGVSSAKITLSWNDTYSDEHDIVYKVQFSDNILFTSEKTRTFYSVASNEKSFYIDNLTSTMDVGSILELGPTVYYRVMAMDKLNGVSTRGLIPVGNETGVWSSVETFDLYDDEGYVLKSRLPAPKPEFGDNAVTAVYNQQAFVYSGDLSLSWTVSTDGVGVEAYYIEGTSTDTKMNFSKSLQYGDAFTSSSSSRGETISTQLQAPGDGQYTLAVTSINAKGERSTSSNYSFVLDTTRPTTVTNLNATGLLHGVTVSWDPSYDASGISGYELYYRQQGTDSWICPYGLNSGTSCTITGLNDAVYEFMVYAYDNAGSLIGGTPSVNNRSLESGIVTATVDSSSDYADTIDSRIVTVDHYAVNTIGGTDPADCFRINASLDGAAKPGQLTLNLNELSTLSGKKAGITVTVMNSTGSILAACSMKSISKKDTVKLIDQLSDPYLYFSITAKNSTEVNSYKLYVNYEAFNTNNADDVPEQLDLSLYSLNNGESFTDWVGYGDTIDYRKLNLTDSGKYSIALSSYAADVPLKVTLYQAQAAGNGAVSLKKLKNFTVKNGTVAGISNMMLDKNCVYYVSVTATKAKSGKNADYELSFNSQALFNSPYSNNADDVWYNDYVTANAVTVPGSERFISYYPVARENWVGFGDAEDYFMVRNEMAGMYNFMISGMNGNLAGKVTLTVYQLVNGGLKKLASVKANANSAGVTTKSLLMEASDKAVYYVSVKSNNAKKGDSVSYSVSVNGETFMMANQADDDAWYTSYVQQNSVTVGIASQTLLENEWVGYGDAIDYRRFTVANSGTYRFTASVTENSTLTIWEETEGRLQKLASASSKTAASTKDVALLSGHTYYFSVEAKKASSGASVDYAVYSSCSMSSFEAPAASASASAAPVLGYGSVIDDQVSMNEPEDIFALNLAEESALELQLDGATQSAVAGGDISVELSGASGNSIALAFTGTTLASESVLASGNYSLEVRSANGKTTDYAFQIAKKA